MQGASACASSGFQMYGWPNEPSWWSESPESLPPEQQVMLPEPSESCCSTEVPQKALANMNKKEFQWQYVDLHNKFELARAAQIHGMYPLVLNEPQHEMLQGLMSFILRDPEADNTDKTMSRAAASAPVFPNFVRRDCMTHAMAAKMRRESQEDAEMCTDFAVKSVERAEKEIAGLGDSDLIKAPLIQALKDATSLINIRPLIKETAALAHDKVHTVLKSKLIFHHRTDQTETTSAHKAVKQACRDMRDIVVMLIKALLKDPTNRAEFQAHVKAICSTQMFQEFNENLHLAYFKDNDNLKCGFVSNNTEARGKNNPRPRRRRKPMRDADQGQDHEDQEQQEDQEHEHDRDQDREQEQDGEHEHDREEKRDLDAYQ